MEKTNPVPKSIQKHSDSEMSIVWASGEKTLVRFEDLRFLCPCAECVDEWTRERRIQRDQIKADIRPLRVEPVGRYAVQIEWSDLHKTGIYPYSMLHEISTGQYQSTNNEARS